MSTFQSSLVRERAPMVINVPRTVPVLRACLMPLLLALAAGPVLADPPDPIVLVASEQLRPGSDGEQQRFGTSMAYTTYRGGRLLVGKPDEDDPLQNIGAVAQYQRVAGGWERVVQFIAPSAFRQENSGFGESVAVFGEWAIVGAPYEDVEGIVDAGAVYFYQYNPNNSYYQFHSRSTLTDVQANSHFGSAVAIGAGRAAAGAPHWDAGGIPDTGRVQLYVLGGSGTTWPLTSSRSPPDAVGNESYGAALAILDAPGSDPDRLFIGAPTTTVDGQAVAGRVHHYQSTVEDWEPVEIMNLFAPEVLDWYGCALAVRGKYLFVGMRGRSKPGGELKGGGVEVQRISEVGVYIPVDTLFPLNEESGARFGAALAIGNGNGPRLIVGAPAGDSDVSGTVIEDAGRVYSFDAVPSGDDSYAWEQTNSVGIGGVPVADDQLGHSVAITANGDTAFAGAPFRVFGAGRVQVYRGDAIFIDGFNPVE